MDLQINKISSRNHILETYKAQENEKKNSKVEMPFSEFLKKSIYNVSDSQKYVQQLNDQLIAGKLDNLHDVTIAAEIANINFLTLINVKNKVMDAYREIMRIQI